MSLLCVETRSTRWFLYDDGRTTVCHAPSSNYFRVDKKWHENVHNSVSGNGRRWSTSCVCNVLKPLNRIHQTSFELGRNTLTRVNSSQVNMTAEICTYSVRLRTSRKAHHTVYASLKSASPGMHVHQVRQKTSVLFPFGMIRSLGLEVWTWLNAVRWCGYCQLTKKNVICAVCAGDSHGIVFHTRLHHMSSSLEK